MSKTPLGKLLILSAPSGAGKTSLCRALIEATDKTEMSISYTTRSCRTGEESGVDYHFIDKGTFKEMIDQDAFLEHALVYEHYYGTGRDAVGDKLNKGVNVLLDVDWQGARSVKSLMSEAISVSILPPSREELERRLNTRGRDSAEIIKKRMTQAEAEMSHCREANFIIVNDDFEKALGDLLNIISGKTEEVREVSVDIDQLINPTTSSTPNLKEI